MGRFILIIYTAACEPLHIEKISRIMLCSLEVMKWSIDSTDCDKVLRIIANQDISERITQQLLNEGIQNSVQGVYHDLIIDSPLWAH